MIAKMLFIMVMSFCAFCTFQKETDSLHLDKRSVDHNNYLTNHGEPKKIGNSYLTEDDIIDSDEDTLFEVKNLKKNLYPLSKYDNDEYYYDYEYGNNQKSHHIKGKRNRIPKVHKVITKQPKKSSSEEIVTYNIGKSIYAGMDRHIPLALDDSELAQAEFKNFKIKPPVDQSLSSEEMIKIHEELLKSDNEAYKTQNTETTVPENSTSPAEDSTAMPIETTTEVEVESSTDDSEIDDNDSTGEVFTLVIEAEDISKDVELVKNETIVLDTTPVLVNDTISTTINTSTTTKTTSKEAAKDETTTIANLSTVSSPTTKQKSR